MRHDMWTIEKTSAPNWYDTGDQGLITLNTVQVVDKRNTHCRLVFVSGHEISIDLDHYDKIKAQMGLLKN